MNWNKPRVTENFEAEDLINQAIERHGDNLYVAFSGGKSSLVVLQMALKVKPDIRVMFCNTGVEMPETVQFVHELKDKWNLNLIETQPYKKTFWDCLKDYGIPSWKSDKSKNRPKCCYYLKHRPAELACKKYGFTACLTGIQGTESYGRRRLIMFCGQRYLQKATNIWQYHPIAFWTDEKVWDYIRSNKIPYNSAYDVYPDCKRTGCFPCTAYRGWQERLGKQNPKLLAIVKSYEKVESNAL
jgi:phosphoadenosine phosphosulfate reductase